jgi:tripartite-type tricarboxylate transporter receptor subunit TctC
LQPTTRIAATLLLSLTGLAPAMAQPYPAKPVRVLVGFPPGAGIDISVRLVTSRLSETLGRQFIVDNRAGAGGNIAVETATRAAPDGYTLVGLSSGAVIAQSAYKKAPFDIGRELAPVAMMALAPLILTAHPSVPAKSLQELVALAKAKPGQFTYATPGTGTAPHVTGELLKLELGIDLLHVPYKGNAPAVADVVGGNVLLSFSNILTALPQVKAGRLRPIAITSAKRSAIAPDVATVAESGLPGFESGTWYGIMTPAGTPRPVVDQLNREIVRVVQLPDTREKFLTQGAEPMTGAPEQMEKFVQSEIVRWAKVVKAAGIRMD